MSRSTQKRRTQATIVQATTITAAKTMDRRSQTTWESSMVSGSHMIAAIPASPGSDSG